MSRPTLMQLETLAEFLTEHPGIAKGLLRTSHGKQETKRMWDDVSISLNALGGAQKDGRSWAKYWADKKCVLKRTCAQHAQSMRRTGGGPADNLPELSPLEQRFIAVMGGAQFAEGDIHVAANPFPSTSQRIEVAPHVPTVAPQPEIEEIELNAPDLLEQIEETLRQTTPQSPLNARSRPQRARRQAPRSRSMLDLDRAAFADIENRRVEAELNTARALTVAVQQLSRIADGLFDIAAAIRHDNDT